MLTRIFSTTLICLLVGAFVPLSAGAASPEGKKTMTTQWKCVSGGVDCGDAGYCDMTGEIVGDKGGDVRRAALRLIFACAQRRGIDAIGDDGAVNCQNAGMKFVPIN